MQLGPVNSFSSYWLSSIAWLDMAGEEETTEAAVECVVVVKAVVVAVVTVVASQEAADVTGVGVAHRQLSSR